MYTYNHTFYECDPQFGEDLKQDGAKADMHKVDMTYLKYFPRSLRELCRVSETGAIKYIRGGWKTVSNGEERYQAAIGRHYLPEGDPVFDEDTQCYHLAQVAWNALAALELYLERIQSEDNRPES